MALAGSRGISDGGLADQAGARAQAIYEAFEQFQAEFGAITRRAPGHFQRREWRLIRADARERLDVYQRIVDSIVAQFRVMGGPGPADRSLWKRARRRYCGLVEGRDDRELGETFFNSVARRVFSTVGVDPEIEFVDPRVEPLSAARRRAAYAPLTGSALEVAVAVLEGTGLVFEDPEGDARRVAAELERLLERRWGHAAFDQVEILAPVFFRTQFAYAVGRVRRGDRVEPLVVALTCPGGGVAADAVLVGAEEVGSVFSLSRSYFHVDAQCPRAVVEFLEPLLPAKPRAELYTVIGHKRHGKTELYRQLASHLARTSDRFEAARGERGLVMVVFTLPSLDLVFKVIRDRPGWPKDTSRPEVEERYRLVFQHDRVGRLVDAQEFEQVRIDRRRFRDELLAELLAQAAETVQLEGDAVVLRHAYIERKVVPLNLFVRERAADEVRAAILEYGEAIKELAAVNIFPGDILLKNFGVKPDGRVVFYDYDELCLLTEVRFRELPKARDDAEEVSGEPWFYVGGKDVFPEELPRFLGLEDSWRGPFMERHQDLFSPGFWRRLQARHEAGETVTVLPYRRRLSRG